jgi:hypothetical protein
MLSTAARIPVAALGIATPAPALSSGRAREAAARQIFVEDMALSFSLFGL